MEDTNTIETRSKKKKKMEVAVQTVDPPELSEGEIYDDDPNDPDYDPDEDEEEEEYEIEMIPDQNMMFVLAPLFAPPAMFHTEEDLDEQEELEPPCKRTKFISSLSRDEKEYFLNLPEHEKCRIINKDQQARQAITLTTPLRFKILNSDMDDNAKMIILSKLDQFQRMHEGSGEYFKLKNWLNAACRLPLGVYKSLPVDYTYTPSEIAHYLQGVRKSLDQTVYGHQEAKTKVMQTLAQWISNPHSKGNCIGIQGAMGVGKTNFIKEGICKALGMPFGFVALGGANDGSFLEGHGFTYEGSTYGKIAEVLMKTQVMNPILFFDELDKVSQTRRGDEIIGILTHLTDSSQNERFSDRYFGEIDLDLSKSLIVFSYNDESLINPILKDRMITINVKGYDMKEKTIIARDYLLPSLFKQFGIQKGDIIISDDIIREIISRVPKEEGVRNLKRGIESVIGWINMLKYLPEKESVKFPLSVKHCHLDKCLKNIETESEPFLSMYT
jgi:ATP-dependent Lon protease